MGTKRTCRLTPGSRFATKKDAENAEFQRKLNSGTNGQRAQPAYEIRPCRCNGWHLMTVVPGGSSL